MVNMPCLLHPIASSASVPSPDCWVMPITLAYRGDGVGWLESINTPWGKAQMDHHWRWWWSIIACQDHGWVWSSNSPIYHPCQLPSTTECLRMHGGWPGMVDVHVSPWWKAALKQPRLGVDWWWLSCFADAVLDHIYCFNVRMELQDSISNHKCHISK